MLSPGGLSSPPVSAPYELGVKHRLRGGSGRPAGRSRRLPAAVVSLFTLVRAALSNPEVRARQPPVNPGISTRALRWID